MASRHRFGNSVRHLGPLSVALSALCVAGLAGCGKQHPASPVATVVEHDNAICTAYARRVSDIAAPSFDPSQATAKDLPAAAKYLDELVPLMHAQREEIRSAGKPNASIALYASILAALDAVIHDEEVARTAAHAGDLQAFRSAYRADTADATHLSGVAHQFGLNACVGG